MSLRDQAAGLGASARTMEAKGGSGAVVRDGDFGAPRTVASGADVARVNRAEGVQLIRTHGADESALRAAGAWRTASGWWIARDATLPFRALAPFLPRYAGRSVTPYVVDLIPQTAWHSSLANILVKRSWDLLREETAAAAGGCEECGVKSGIECHEMWEYDEAGPVQRLIGLNALCAPCHETRHLGFARVRGRFEVAFDRLCLINRIEDRERVRYHEVVESLFLRRSRFEWAMDMSLVSGRGLKLRRSFGHLGQGRIGGRAKDRMVEFDLVETEFEVGEGSIVLV